MRFFSILIVAIFCSCSGGSGNNDPSTNNRNNTNNTNNVTNQNNQNNSNNRNNQNNSNNNNNNTNNTNQTIGCTVPLGPDRDFDGIEDSVDNDPDDPFDFLAWTPQGSTRHSEDSIPQFVAATWDGALLFGTTGAEPEYTVSALRKNAVATSSLDSTSFSNATPFSPNDTSDGNGDLAVFSADGDLPAATLPNPYRSDAVSASDPNGGFATYKLGVVGTSNSPANSPSPIRLTLSNATVVLDTSNETIESAAIDSIATPLESTGNESLWGGEPTVSLDGRLIVWSGLPSNQFEGRAILYSFNATPQLATGWSAPANIAAIYSTHGGGAANEPMIDGVAFSDRYPIARNPIRQPNGAAFGANDLILGQHPRLSADASELFFSAIATFEGAFESAVVAVGVRTQWTIRHLDGAVNPSRSTLSLSGEITAPGVERDMLKATYDLTVIGSEPIGPDGYARSATPLFLSGTMWTPFLGRVDPPLPRNGLPETYGFVMRSGRYAEAPMPQAHDQHEVVSLSMNEQVVFDQTALAQIQNGAFPTGPAFDQAVRQAIRYDTTTTPDVSGNRHHGTLNGGAAFPFEYHDAVAQWNVYWEARQLDPNLPATRDGVAGDVIEGVKGNAIFFPGGSSVETNLALELTRFDGDMTIQFWVKPLQATAADLVMFAQIGIAVDANQIVTATTDGIASSASSPLNLDGWNFVALSFTNDEMTLTVNDEKIVADLANPIIPNDGAVIIGPKAVAATVDALYLVDEFSISDTTRTKKELGYSAFSRRGLPTLRGSDFGAPAPFDLLPAYAPRDAVPAAETVALGQALFESKQLSDDRSMSCATCHDPEKGFADNETTAIGVFGRSNDRNSQTVVNRLFSTAQFWDGRAASTEEQALGPIQAETEMNLSLDEALDRINSDPEFAPLFQAAWGSMCIDRERLARSIGAYVRTIVAPTARFDTGQLNAQEQHGEALFFGKARCANCHSGATFTDERFHNPGFDVAIDSDRGRARVTGRLGDLARFKTPTLRELVHTGPYFHDGSFDELEQVVFFYNTGGVTDVNRDFSVRPLGLSDQEQAALVAFLRTLSSE